MGIEPTWDLVEPHAGFEDQERHQIALHLQPPRLSAVPVSPNSHHEPPPEHSPVPGRLCPKVDRLAMRKSRIRRGQHQISDRSGKFLARYDSVTNQTFDRSGRFVGRGDLRARFISDE
jgi:hypothetical protein